MCGSDGGKDREGKGRRKGVGSREGWYPVPCHCPAGTVGQERPTAPGELCLCPPGTQDWALRCWQMPGHGCRILRAEDIYHLMYSLVLWQRGSTERTTGWSWAHRGRSEVGRTGMAGAERKRREGKQEKRECQEGWGWGGVGAEGMSQT